MKRRRAITFFFSVAAISAATIAYAAGEATKATGDSSLLVVVAVIFNGLASLGGTGLLVKKYMAKVDKDGEAIPQLTATLQAAEKAIAAHTDSLKELYGSRNAHQDDLTQIKTIHKIKGCDQAVKST